MAGNNRIYYPIHQAGLRTRNAAAYTAIHGLQSASMTTTFNLSQVFELGQLAIYENIEEVPDVEVTLSKVLDGHPPMFTLATTGASNPLLQKRAGENSLFAMSLFDDTISSTSSETVRTVVESSGMFVSSVSYSFPLDDNFTEDITFVGNDRIWQGDSRLVESVAVARAAALSFPGAFDGTDTPQGTNQVNRREDLLLTTTSGGTDSDGFNNDPAVTILPTEVFGIGSNGINTLTSDFRARLANISVSVDLNRESLNELGRKTPYSRTASFPVEVTTEIEITSTSGDFISVTEDGILTSSTDCTGDLGNIGNQTIRIATCEGLRLYMGNKNRLSSVNYGGGDAGGGNVSVSYSYSTFNHLTVMHANDPAAGLLNFDITDAVDVSYLTGGGNI